MEPEAILKKVKAEMQKALDHTTSEFATLHTGKASPSMVESIPVEVYGSTMKVMEVAAITTPDARLIRIQPWDKSSLKAIEKGIQTANIGLNPIIEGDIIRCPIPELSRERRQELGKMAHSMAEQGRIGIRAARKDGMDLLKAAQKDEGLSEDDAKRYEKEIQKLTDQFNADIAAAADAKEKDLIKM